MRRSAVALLVPLIWCSPGPGHPVAQEAAWGRFRGPNGGGVSATTGLPAEFGPASNIVWNTPLPPGHSSPVLTATRVFVTAHTADKERYTLSVIGLDRRTGRIVWQRDVPRRQKGRLQNVNGAASPSPVTDGSPSTRSSRISGCWRIPSTARNDGACHSARSTSSTASARRPSWSTVRSSCPSIRIGARTSSRSTRVRAACDGASTGRASSPAIRRPPCTSPQTDQRLGFRAPDANHTVYFNLPEASAAAPVAPGVRK